MLEAPNKPESKKLALSFYPQVKDTSETLPQSQVNDSVTIDNSSSVAPTSAIPIQNVGTSG